VAEQAIDVVQLQHGLRIRNQLDITLRPIFRAAGKHDAQIHSAALGDAREVFRLRDRIGVNFGANIGDTFKLTGSGLDPLQVVMGLSRIRALLVKQIEHISQLAAVFFSTAVRAPRALEPAGVLLNVDTIFA